MFALIAMVASLVVGVDTAAAQGADSRIGPSSEPASQEELDFYAELVTCPAVGGFDVVEQQPSVGGETATVRCAYDNNSVAITLTWNKPDTVLPSNCTILPTFERDDRIVLFAGLEGYSIRAEADYAPEPYDADRAQWQAAIDTLAAQVESVAVDRCPPPGMTCTDPLPNLEILFDPDIAPESYSGLWEASCWWAGVPDADDLWSELIMSVQWSAEGMDGALLTSICGYEDSFEWGTGFVDGPDNLAVGARFDYREADRKFDVEVARAEAIRLMDLVVPQAQSCEGVPFSPRSGDFQEVPPYLAAALDPALSVGLIDINLDGSGVAPSAAAIASGTAPTLDAVAESPSSGSGGSGGSDDGPLWAKLITPVLLVFSLVMLFITLLLARRENRIRPTMEILRLVIMTAVAAVSIVVFNTATPLWAIALAIVIGAGLGLSQGRNLVLRMGEKGPMGKRSTLAIVAFGAGLIVTQIAGLLNRSGAITFGLALTALSAAVTVGLIVGRRAQLAELRAATLAVFVGAILLGPLVAPLAQAYAQDDEAVSDPIRDLIVWEDLGIVGGLGINDNKPLVPIDVSEGLLAAPIDLDTTTSWTSIIGDQTTIYDLTESYTFGDLIEGQGFPVGYSVTGTIERDIAGTVTLRTVDMVGDLAPISLLTTPSPFGQSRLAGLDGCVRPLTQSAGNGEWTKVLIDGEQSNIAPNQPLADVAVDCDIEGFTIGDAIAAAPQQPEASAGSCAPYQDVVAGMDDGSWQPENVDADTLTSLYSQPNSTNCTSGMVYGSDARGATRMEVNYDLASSDAATYVNQQWDAHDGMLGRFQPHEIAEADRCGIDANGISINQPGQEQCLSINNYDLDDGQIFIFTDTATADGPNVFIRGVFSWGSIRARCHHCDPSDPRIPALIESWRREGPNWSGPTELLGEVGRPQPEPVPTTTAAPTEADQLQAQAEALGVDADTIDLFVPEGADDETRAAAIAALVGAMGAAGLLASALGDAGMSAQELADAFRNGGVHGLADALREEAAAEAAVTVMDEHGQPMRPGEDGRYDWGGRRVTRSELEELITDQRGANKDRARQVQSLIDEGNSNAAAAERFAGLATRSQADADADTLMQEIRDGWQRVEDLGSAQERYDRTAARIDALDLTQAARDQTYWDNPVNWVAEVASTFNDRMWDDFVSLTRFDEENAVLLMGEGIYETTRTIGIALRGALDAVAEAASHPEAGTILWETMKGTAYDVFIGSVIGDPDTYDHFVQATDTIATVGALARDNAGAIVQALTGVDQLIASMDPDLPLHDRMQHFAAFAAEALMAGSGFIDEGVDAVRAVDAAADARRAAEATADARRAAEAAADARRAADAAADAERVAQAAEDARRAADAAGDTRRAAEAAEDARRARDVAANARRLADATEARRVADAAADARRVADDLAPPPAGWVDDLPEGAAIERNVMHEVGYSQAQVDELAAIANKYDIQIGSRSTNPDSMHWIRDGKAVPKPVGIKSKTINSLDTYIGANKADEGLVGYFRPSEPNMSHVPADLQSAVQQRYAQRLEEYYKLRGDVDGMVLSGEVVERNGMLFKVGENGREIPYAGDIDLVYLRNADGTHLSGDKFLEVMEDLKASGAGIQHGPETDVINHLTKGLEPGSPEWHEAYQKAIKLHESLEDAHLSGAEMILQIGSDGVLRRGPRLDELPRLSQS